MKRCKSLALRVALSGSALILAACSAVQPITMATTPSAEISTLASTPTQPLTTTAAQQGGQGYGEPGPLHCSMAFEATVRQGPSTGLALAGLLDFSLAAGGSLTGTLTLKDQTEAQVVGQVNGRAINLIVHPPKAFVFGVGTAFEPIAGEACGKILGGPFVGPKPGDTGDWLAGGRGSPSSHICDAIDCN